jgi:predicted aldo/keto reductase-like oxidoreductase
MLYSPIKDTFPARQEHGGHTENGYIRYRNRKETGEIMQYREFGRTGKKTSLLGFGCMRLPIHDNDPSRINESEAIAMIREAIDQGVNYIDTAYPYHRGTSEALTGKALRDGYREKVYIATKLPIWLVESKDDTEKYLNEQLERLGTEHIDFYLVHSLSEGSWANTQKHEVLRTLEKAKADGRIGHIGFSFHDRLKLFKEIVDAYPWEFTQIQLNFMDEEYQAGLEGMRYAEKTGMGIVIMEPLRGGKLTKKVPPDIEAVWSKAKTSRTPAEWALRWVFDHPEVDVVLSGMSTMEQVKENIAVAVDSPPNSLSTEEKELISTVRDMYRTKIKVMCTDCGYCLPCPEGVDIPGVFSLFNDSSVYDTPEESARWYASLTKAEKDAVRCVECGQCLSACPQGISIIKHLKEAHKVLHRD